MSKKMPKKILVTLGILIGSFLILYFVFPGTMFSILARLERGSAGLTLKSINAAGWQTPYLEGGQGETVLLIHGFGGDKDNFTRFAKYLTGKYRVISPDLPGFGENQRKPDENYAYSKQVPRIIALLDALQVDKFHVAGNSMGGCISGLLAEAFPERVLSATLIDNAGFQEPQMSEREKITRTGVNPLLVNNVEDFDRLMDFIFVNRPFIPGPLKEYFAVRAVQNRGFNEKIFQDISEERYLLQSKFADVKVPVLVIWGDTDRVIDVSATETMKKIKPDIEVQIMPQTGHSPMLEKPNETAQLMLDFIKNK